MFDISKNGEIKEFVYWWNSQFPFDYIWRNKYNIPFNSSQHREMSFIDIKIEIEESKLYKELPELIKKQRDDKENYAITGDWLNRQSIPIINDDEFLNWKI